MPDNNTVRILALIVLFSSPLFSEVISEGGREPFKIVQMGTEVFGARDGTQDIRLGAGSRTTSLLHLKFDQPIPALLSDDAGNYRVRANYSFHKDSVAGPGAAGFARPENKILLSAPAELWPGTGDVDDFTIDFWIRPVLFYNRNSIFQKMSLLEGSRRGMEIYLEGGRIHVEFFNLFRDDHGIMHNLHLVATEKLLDRTWGHVVVQFNAATGKTVLYVNRKEQASKIAGSADGVWRMRFLETDRSPLVIGDSFFGSMDEFRISNGVDPVEELPAGRYAAARIEPVALRADQGTGTVLSSVYNTGAAVSGRFSYSSIEPPGSAIDFYIRFSNHPFSQTATDTGELRWRRIHSFTDQIGGFSYLQWKAVFRADPAGQASPVLKETALNYVPARPPSKPGGLRIVPELSGSEFVCLEWRRNPEPEIESKGGYVIYYGMRPGEYTGRIVVSENGKKIRQGDVSKMPVTELEKKRLTYQPETIRRFLSGRIRFVLTNKIIEENIYSHARQKNMPFLHPDRTYYFTVSAMTEEGESEQQTEAVFVLKPPADL